MFFSSVQRKNLRKVVEEAIPMVEDGDRKNLFLIIAALIQDLAETENRIYQENQVNRGYNFVKEIQKLIEECNHIAANEAEGVSVQHFTALAENMRMMSDSLFVLRDLLLKVQQEPVKKETLQ